MDSLRIAFIYVLFFLSGAAALMYEVIWVRSLGLVFGGTHLAVAVVLSVFMGGLALGSYLIGSRADAVRKPLRLYGYLELGIVLSALAFLLLMKVYPAVYIFLAGGRDDQTLYLTLVRILFACVALIVPTTLMGGTLPLLTRFVSKNASGVGAQLPLLYGFNTFGAVAGAAAAGFFLLRFYSVSTTLHTAMAINLCVGIASLLLQGWTSAVPAKGLAKSARNSNARGRASDGPVPAVPRTEDPLPPRLVFYGIGISGFCALGYEVLWTRVLTLTVGTSVYGFTTMLAAFLTGIALGSAAYGLAVRWFRWAGPATRSLVFGFGLVQVLIGASALVVTVNIRDLPIHALSLNAWYVARGLGVFDARLWASVTVAFSYMLIPAFFMGVAFPLAGQLVAGTGRKTGEAVGSVLTCNTIGAIFGSAVSGFVLVYLVGIERSLQLLITVNAGLGLLVLVSLLHRRWATCAAGAAMLACLAFLVVNHEAFRVWDAKFFAIFQNNVAAVYDTPDRRREAIANTDVLYRHEGIHSTISVIRPKGAQQAVLVNGKVVASSSLQDQQCQFTLGHLPMLLHPNPAKVLVVGLGTGMTLGAAAVHPEVRDITLLEIEPGVVGAARTFGQYNHQVLDNPRLKIIFNDGRNFLTTTKNQYDVITADPIHPWTQGSGYLYTDEYFTIAAARLRPGGIMCQWLPLYELSTEDVKSVIRTFSRSFRYTMVWLTQYDAELIGSNSPIVVDEQELDRRIAQPAVFHDLDRVMMGSATDFLSYFLMASAGMRAFSADGIVNTDDNLYLEFSTPRSTGINLMRGNVNALVRYRESLLPHLVPAPPGKPRAEQSERWRRNGEAAVLHDQAQGLFLAGFLDRPEFQGLRTELSRNYPAYAPGKFLQREYDLRMSQEPSLLRQIPLPVLNERAEQVILAVSAVAVRVSAERAAVIFVDNARRKIYGRRYFSGPGIEEQMAQFAKEVEVSVLAAYSEEAARIRSQAAGRDLPTAQAMDERVQTVITSKIGD